MQRLTALARGNPFLAGGIAAAVIAAIAAVIVVAVVAAGGSSSAAPEPTPEPTPTSEPTAKPTATRTATRTPSPTPTPSAHFAILDGTYMSEAEWEARKDLLPLAVMFDNTPSSYPHTGLDKADVIYESFVEGGITRLMAVFWKQEADVLLPVRSARTPFVIWVDELGALYGHAGSSHTTDEADAGGQLIEWQIKDLDAFDTIANRAYYRVDGRFAPYNLATSTERLREMGALKGYAGPPTVEPWLFLGPEDTPAVGTPAGGVEVDFGGRRTGWQLIHWKWDEAAGAYGRSMFGGPQEDGETGEQLMFRTVIVMTVPGFVANTRGHYLLEQFGEGKATIFMRGQAFEATWKKADREARTRFYDAAGNEILFERGPIFIEVLGTQSKFTVTATAEELPALPKYTPPPPQPPSQPVDEETPPPTATKAPSPTAEPTQAEETIEPGEGEETPEPGDEETPEPTATQGPRESPTPLQLGGQ